MAIPHSTKFCNRCKSELPATPEFFYRKQSSKNGLHSLCKRCDSLWRKEHRKELRDYNRRYHLEHHAELAERQHHYRLVNRTEKSEQRRLWGLAHPEKQRAIRRRTYEKHRESILLMAKVQRAVVRAIKSGQLVRPEICDTCHQPGKIQGHHYLGYAPEHWLTVRWLCTKCHMKEHRKYP